MRIAVINTPFATHVGRMEFAFQSLRDLGHEIELWGSGATRTIAERNGFIFREIPLETDYAQVLQRRLKPHEIFNDMFFSLAREQIPVVLEYCDRYAPDVIEANARVFAAVVASRLNGITVVTHCCSGSSFSQMPEDLYGFCVKGDEQPRQLAVMRRLSDEFFRMTDEWFNEYIGRPYGLGEVTNAIGQCAPEFAIAQTIKELSKARIAALDNVHLTGPIVTEPPVDLDFSQYQPYCYVSLGTSPWNVADIIERYRALVSYIPARLNIVIGLGGLIEPEALGIEDERVTVFAQAPQIAAIRYAEFVICHGGCQTVHEALYFGKPILGIPHHAEVSEMVNSVEINGAGVRLSPSQVSESSVAEAVDSVTSPESQRNADRLAELLRRADGCAGALQIFKQIASREGARAGH